jgi:hypothetical protein
LGNWFNNELYGSHTDLPWGLKVYDWNLTAGRPYLDANGEPRVVPGGPFHPTFLYELLWNLGVAVAVYYADRRWRLGKGRAFALYVAGYTVGRFWVEALRIDEAHHFLGLRLNDWTSLLVLAGALVYLYRVRGPQEHMRIDEDGTVHIVTADGAPIPTYPPVKPAQASGGGASTSGTDGGSDWVATTRRRASQLWTSVTSRWAGVEDEDEPPAGTPSVQSAPKPAPKQPEKQK